ncbi:MAG: PilZ domain-containing protein [Nitrospinae bacterium]|nr:PilZ domain-containing protein [Nitrospinota bacterium]
MAILETVRKLSKSKKSIPPAKVETPGRINAIIDSVLKERRMLEVAVDERLQIFSSSGIIERSVFKDNPCLVIDTLIPKLEGIRALEGSASLLIGFRLNEVPHTFESSFLAFRGEDRAPIVAISYPQVIHIHQFRGAFRLSPTLSEPITVNVEAALTMKKQAGTSGPEAETGTVEKFLEEGNVVEDISMEGMAFLTKNPKLTKGTEVFIDFGIPGVGSFGTMAVVMNLARTESTKYPFKCGVSFMDFTKADQERLYRYILEKQREEIKKKQGMV